MMVKIFNFIFYILLKLIIIIKNNKFNRNVMDYKYNQKINISVYQEQSIIAMNTIKIVAYLVNKIYY